MWQNQGMPHLMSSSTDGDAACTMVRTCVRNGFAKGAAFAM